MTSPTYTPRAGSLASQVIGFFRHNPDEELLLDDITDKFAATRGNVHTLLSDAVKAELLGELPVDLVLRAQAAIEAMRDRYLRTGRWGADAAALQDVPPMLDFYDELLAHGSPRVMVDALKVTVKRMNMQRGEA